MWHPLPRFLERIEERPLGRLVAARTTIAENCSANSQRLHLLHASSAHYPWTLAHQFILSMIELTHRVIAPNWLNRLRTNWFNETSCKIDFRNRCTLDKASFYPVRRSRVPFRVLQMPLLFDTFTLLACLLVGRLSKKHSLPPRVG